MRPVLSALLLLLLVAPGLLAEDEDGENAADAVRKRFWEARKILVAGDPASAAELFRTVHKKAPKSEVADDCLYWMGRCYLRLPDREAAAVTALNRLIRDYPRSPFLDEAARELDRLEEREVVKDLLERLKAGGEAAEPAARALAEFGEKAGVRWLRDKELEVESKDIKRGMLQPTPQPDALAKEVAELRAEVKRLKAEVMAAIELVKKLLERRAEDGK